MNYKGWSTASSFSAWSVTGARGCNCFLKMTRSKSLFGFDQNFDRVPMIEDIGNNNHNHNHNSNNNHNSSDNNDKSINAKCWMTRDNQTPLFRWNDAKANRASKISMLSLLLWKNPSNWLMKYLDWTERVQIQLWTHTGSQTQDLSFEVSKWRSTVESILALQPQVWFLAFRRIFLSMLLRFIDSTAWNSWHWPYNVNWTQLILASGKLVLQK